MELKFTEFHSSSGIDVSSWYIPAWASYFSFKGSFFHWGHMRTFKETKSTENHKKTLSTEPQAKF